MTPVRGKRGKWVHWTHDLRTTLCRKKCDGWIVEPDTKPTCEICLDASTTN